MAKTDFGGTVEEIVRGTAGQGVKRDPRIRDVDHRTCRSSVAAVQDLIIELMI